ncbi:MAG: helix-turn-helix domain-containing protein [Candidatus Marinimicrobia bacterium]|nr:helix-turn-helix domain-containing protein [Candidatus Neomarinimicrobiota bacterium]
MKSFNDSQWMNLKTASEYAAVSVSWLRQQIDNGRLKCVRTAETGGKLLVKREWIDDLLLGESK